MKTHKDESTVNIAKETTDSWFHKQPVNEYELALTMMHPDDCYFMGTPCF